MDPLGRNALALVEVAAEWLALGWLSRVDWPGGLSTFWAPRWALRLLVGAVLTATAQLALALVGIGFGNVPVTLAAAAACALALRLLSAKLCHTEKLSMDQRERAGWLLLAAVLLAATARALLVPEAGWDAYSHWGLRAQAFALAGTVVDAHSEHEYYPPLVPMLEAWLYLNGGAVSIDLGKAVWAMVGSAFAICLSWHLRLSLRLPWLAPLLGTAIVLCTTALLENFWTGQADLALSAYLTLATLALLQRRRTPHRIWLIQAAFFAAAATMSKFEGFPRIGVLVVALLIEALVSRRRTPLVAPIVVAAAACVAWLAWTAFEITHAIAPNAEHFGQFQPLAIGGVLVSLVAVLGGVRTGGGVLVAILAWLVAGRRLVAGPLRLVSLVVLGQLSLTLLAFVLSNISPDIEVRTSATRLFEQFLPLALFAAALGLIGEPPTGSDPAEPIIGHWR